MSAPGTVAAHSAIIWWIRRDLRLNDNPALAEAVEASCRVVPLFIFDPALLSSSNTSPRRLEFLCCGLRILDEALRKRGSRLIVRSGRPNEVLDRVMRETGATLIVVQEDFSPYARQRDARVAAHLPLRRTRGLTVLPPDLIVKPDGTPYAIFTPFRRRWETVLASQHLAPVEAPVRLAAPDDLATEPIPACTARFADFPPGEAQAHRRLASFVRGERAHIYRYAALRDRVDLDGTSRLSPYLRFGMISAREVMAAAMQAARTAPDASSRESARVYVRELIWREFFVSVLRHFPHVLRREFRPELRGIRWDNDEAAFAAWRTGHTGFPVVDAAMRHLAKEGWMHNRARMIVASFLVKDLLIDWRRGERHFMRHLLDGDPAANNGGWQWIAGVGTDAAPYFRVFNPVLQGMKADPRGDFVRRWVSELARVPERFIHKPWTMPPEVQEAAGCRIGQDYPAPIVDHAQARARAIARYRSSRVRK